MSIKNTGCNTRLWFACLFLLPLQAKADAGHTVPSDTAVNRVTIRTNLLHDVTATLNLGAEFALSERFSLDIPFSYNPWTFGSDRYCKLFLVQPELRYWPDRRPAGHFFGLHAHYGTYNASRLPDFLFSDYMHAHRFDGWLAGAGVSYGYRWKLNPKWSLEAILGVGYAYLDYDKYPAGDSEISATGNYHYLGPTRIGVTLGYTLGRKNTARTRSSRPITYRPLVAAKREELKDPETEPVTEPGSRSKAETKRTAEPGAEIAPVHATPQKVPTGTYTAPQAEPLQQRSEKGTAWLDFAKGSSAIDYDFAGNAAELRKIHELVESIGQDPYARITGISLVGHASPEGFASDNLLLSAHRAAALKDHLKTVHCLRETLFTTDGRGEDWRTIDSLVAALPDIKKYMALEIIRGTRDADRRELRLREEWPDLYSRLRREVYPRLRRIEYEVTYTVLPSAPKTGEK